jgi:formate hydrogenlyase subunit 4
MTSSIRLYILVLLLSVVLLYAWVKDRPTPANPRGEFGGIVLFATLVVCLALTSVFLVRLAFSLTRRWRKQ